MLAFVTSLRHPQNSADYDQVEALLSETLSSVTAQTDDDFVVVVVGNQRPRFDLGPKVEFVEVDFPPPAPPDGPRTAREPFVWDKGTKVGLGLVAAAKHRPDHVMIFDADDFVSRHIAAFARTNPGRGWYVSEGWMYSRARGVYTVQRDFHRTCGTSLIVPYDAYAVPEHLPLLATQSEIAAAYGERLTNVLGAHRDAVHWFSEHGVDLAPLPFPGAVYHVDTGENHSGKTLRGHARPLDARIRQDFGVPRTREQHVSWWWAWGPLALAESALRRARALLTAEGRSHLRGRRR